MANGSVPAEATTVFNPESRFVRAGGVLWRQVADVILVRTVADPEIVELKGAAALLWIALVEPVTADELASDLAAVAGAAVDVVARDVRIAVADLVHRGLVTVLGAA
jgi:hypothetical protein